MSTDPQPIKAVLLTVPYEGEDLVRLKAALGDVELVQVAADDWEAIDRALQLVDVAFLRGDLDDRFANAPHLKWVHCGHAGIEASARLDILERGITITGASGRSAPALAEHVMYFMLSFAYDTRRLLKAQREHHWAPANAGQHALFGSTIGLIGFGATGSEVARRAKAFEMHVMAYRRRPLPSPNIDQLLAADRGDKLDDLLTKSDFIVAATNLSDHTYHLVAKRELALMKSSAYFINISRGNIVDEDALISALQTGSIAGAGLDNFTKEPLPQDSPLWDLPNVLITPHSTPPLIDRDQRALAILCDNIARYKQGMPLLNALTRRDVYTPGKG
ncbi:MAG: D-2-hydroxyacid dehydrogenase [Actinomycetota bacterium]|nr:D-2-hydroxyacid dehydrogenase [Actinomycetota bacterium]